MKSKFIIVALLLMIFAPCGIAAQTLRESYSINDNWRYFTSSAWDSDNAEYVSLPHTWNREVGTHDYERQVANYTREIEVPEEWRGRRLFIRFGGVQNSAELFINGAYVGSHRGGFTAFAFEITDLVRYGSLNTIRLMVSNVWQSDVLPTSSDMNLGGGIHRGVELLVTNKTIISPLHHASDGVYVEQHSATEESASGVVRVMLSASASEHPMVNLRIVDKEGYEVFRRSLRVSRLNEEQGVELAYEIQAPELWSPSSPTLYSVEVSIGDIADPTDKVVVATGFRSVRMGDDNRLYINDEAIAVRGVGLPHDCQGYGWALGEGELAAMLRVAQDMGANALRSLSGPHDDGLYQMCDREGMLVWVDMPLTRAPYSFTDVDYFPTTSFCDNGVEQLREIIAQNYNHPSVVMWGLFSLVSPRGNNVVDYIEELNDLAHTLDGSRLTVGSSNADGDINFITDAIVLRQDVGWSRGSAEDLSVWCRQLLSNRAWGALRYGACYGEEGAMSNASEGADRASRGTRNLPERRQSLLHGRYADILCSSNIFWGVWIETLFDYASMRRQYGLNQAGVVAYDHSTRKDAFYLYRAMWNEDEPTLHIAHRRWRERRDTLQYIDIYSSVGEPIVVVEGDTLPTRRIAEAQYRADSVVMRGSVRVRAYSNDGAMCDSVDLQVGGYAAGY